MVTPATTTPVRRPVLLQGVLCLVLALTLLGLWRAVMQREGGWLAPGILGLAACALWAAVFSDVPRALWGWAMLGHLLAVAFFCHWLILTDLLFGHHMGPPRLFIASAVAGAWGFACTLLWALWHAVKSSTRRDDRPRRSWGAVLGSWVVCLSMIPSGLIAWTGVQGFPRARTQMTLDEVNRIVREQDASSAPNGAAPSSRKSTPAQDVGILMDAMKDKDANVRYIALHALAGLGPSAKPAQPELLRIIDTYLHGSKPGSAVTFKIDDATALAAVMVLGNIGPDARDAIPPLLEAARLPAEGDFSGRDYSSIRLAARQSLAKVGFEGEATPQVEGARNE